MLLLPGMGPGLWPVGGGIPTDRGMPSATVRGYGVANGVLKVLFLTAIANLRCDFVNWQHAKRCRAR